MPRRGRATARSTAATAGVAELAIRTFIDGNTVEREIAIAMPVATSFPQGADPRIHKAKQTKESFKYLNISSDLRSNRVRIALRGLQAAAATAQLEQRLRCAPSASRCHVRRSARRARPPK